MNAYKIDGIIHVAEARRDAPAYTQDEWETTTSADTEFDSDGRVLFLGKLLDPQPTVRRCRLPRWAIESEIDAAIEGRSPMVERRNDPLSRTGRTLIFMSNRLGEIVKDLAVRRVDASELDRLELAGESLFDVGSKWAKPGVGAEGVQTFQKEEGH